MALAGTPAATPRPPATSRARLGAVRFPRREHSRQCQCRDLSYLNPPCPAPEEELFDLITPRSRCPHCQRPIAAWENIPLVSYLRLKGRCAGCGKHIGARYPIIEAATALLSAIVAWHFGFGWAAAAAHKHTWGLIALSVIDFDHQLLPDSITLTLLWLGLLLSW